MTDERAGAGRTRSEDARRFYEQGGGQAAASGETVVRTASSHYGAQTGGASPSGDTMDRQQRHPDPRYHEWRAAQVDAMDRDYDAFRASHKGDPADAFGAWQAKRAGRRDDAQSAPKGGSSDAERNLALGEKPGQGSDGPHILDRSFSGTYDD